jgi:hypothetical protein
MDIVRWMAGARDEGDAGEALWRGFLAALALVDAA